MATVLLMLHPPMKLDGPNGELFVGLEGERSASTDGL